MGRWNTYANGQNANNVLFNMFIDYTEYATLSALNTASSGWGVAEKGRISYVQATAIYYIWNGSANNAIQTFYSGGGGGSLWLTGTASGRSPIVKAHGGDGITASSKVVASPNNGLQPYTFLVNVDATNLTIYHNAAGSLTFSYIIIP